MTEIDRIRSLACQEFPIVFRTNKLTGASRTGAYRSWSAMKARCLNKKNNAYSNYGARGITIDPAWLDFKQFLADMGARPIGMTLDRIDFNLGYSKGNCRWATPKVQANNRRLQW